ncbi:MAG: MBOAT family protein [Lewinellaceae bacterium]|nr:MBOAT family protein [Saprospiraceae bacterium]MCB9343174.1 MBOAT family protein [Lewinellaceae bacterium]
MIFNSLAFLLFILIFFPLYFGTKGKGQHRVCLIASYFFYGCWDWRFLSLIILSTLLDWCFGMWISHLYQNDGKSTNHQNKAYRFTHRIIARLAQTNFTPRAVLVLSIAMNLGVLGFFKYFNFFADSLAMLLQSIGFVPSWNTLHIILPVGISFYTFQSMSYTIDVYRRELKQETSLLKFATYIALFPQLVAGPIIRAADFLPQLAESKRFDYTRFNSGMGRILWGFFKKVAIADSLAPFVDQCFQSPQSFGSLHLMIGVVFYSFQIYCDFSGYSDIAIGLTRIMGFHFPENFRTPYFSRSFSEFWTRWHISLSSWLRDYLYIPLGGNRHGKLNTYRNNMLTMLLGGLWHGANWAFVFWGLLHGVYMMIQRIISPIWHRVISALKVPAIFSAGVEMGTVYLLTLFAWVFFRSGSQGLAGGDSFGTAYTILSHIGSGIGLSFSEVINKFQVLKGGLLISMLLLIELSNLRYRWNEWQLRQPYLRIALFSMVLWLLAFFGNFGANAFIYFQF